MFACKRDKRVRARALILFITYPFFWSPRHNLKRNTSKKSATRWKARPTCGGCKKSKEIRRIRLRSKWTYKEKTRKLAHFAALRCWLSSRWTSRPTLICTPEIEFSPFSHRILIPSPEPFPPVFSGLAKARAPASESGTQVRRDP